MGDTQLV